MLAYDSSYHYERYEFYIFIYYSRVYQDLKEIEEMLVHRVYQDFLVRQDYAENLDKKEKGVHLDQLALKAHQVASSYLYFYKLVIFKLICKKNININLFLFSILSKTISISQDILESVVHKEKLDLLALLESQQNEAIQVLLVLLVNQEHLEIQEKEDLMDYKVRKVFQGLKD